MPPFLQVNTLTQGGNRRAFEMNLQREKETLAIKHRQINAPVSPFLQVNTLTQGGNRKVFEMNLQREKKKILAIKHRQINAPVSPFPPG